MQKNKNDKEPPRSTCVIQKLIFGESINAGELIEALSDKNFKQEELIVLETDHSGILNSVFLCEHCDKVHLYSGEHSPSEIFDIKQILIDRTYTADSNSINIKELVAVLKKFEPGKMLVIANEEDEGDYALSGVEKCPHCGSAHLFCGYPNHTMQ